MQDCQVISELIQGKTEFTATLIYRFSDGECDDDIEKDNTTAYARIKQALFIKVYQELNESSFRAYDPAVLGVTFSCIPAEDSGQRRRREILSNNDVAVLLRIASDVDPELGEGEMAIMLQNLLSAAVSAGIAVDGKLASGLNGSQVLVAETTTVPEQDNTAQWLAPTIAGLVSAIILIAIVIALILVVVRYSKRSDAVHRDKSTLFQSPVLRFTARDFPIGQSSFSGSFFGSDSSSSNDGWSTGRRAGNAKRKMNYQRPRRWYQESFA
ncbi:hypothetical protein EB796_008080 [Bugula neritina]|uniref:Uncharacterized protein n=1 Tax=Bugula neritina TaxID=10212 RepID=A0A7J7K4P6_BUGNE|nr:hypothetical protein EB796_008080 [Bugula neritina]